MQLFFTLTAPHHWATLDSKGIAESGVSDGLEELPLGAAYQHITAVAPGELIVTRSIDIPSRNRQKILAAIPFSVEDALADNIDDVHFVLLEIRRDHEVAFAYVNNAVMQGWLDLISTAGIHIDALLPDYFLLPAPQPGSATLTRAENGSVLIRDAAFSGCVVDEMSLPLWLAERGSGLTLSVDGNGLGQDLLAKHEGQIEEIEIGNALADWLGSDNQYDGPEMLQGRFKPADAGGLKIPYRIAASIFLLAILLVFTADVAEFNWLNRQHVRLKEVTAALYQELFPGARLVSGKARVQIKNRIDALQLQQGSNKFISLLTAAGLLFKQTGAQVEELKYRDSVLTVVSTLRDFSHLDRVKQAFEKNTSVDARLVQSGAKGNKVQARFEISGRAK